MSHALVSWLARDPTAWLVAIGAPLVMALLLWVPRCRRPVQALAPFAAVPALLLAVVAPAAVEVEASWLLLEVRLVLDEVRRVFLLLTAALWLLAGVYARGYLAHGGHGTRFFVSYLLTMAGNLGLLLAGDLPAFYTLFALMTYAAYGLVVHTQTGEAVRAGRIYIAMAVVGEMFLFTGMMLAVAGMPGQALADVPEVIAASPRRGWIIGFFVAGLGVKAGALPVHVWLPLAHPVAPTPASAVLSGVMIKAGLFGWLQLLPLGQGAIGGWGAWGLIGGMSAAYAGVLLGLTQRDPKTVLAYSSISQMGLMTVGVGAGLAAGLPAPHAIHAITAFALHHGLAKAALFLGVGVAERRMGRRGRAVLIVGLALPVLALAGLPLTSGAAAKKALEGVVQHGPGAAVLKPLLSLASMGTLLVLLRFLWVLRDKAGHEPEPPPWSMWLSWALTTLAGVVAIWVVPWAGIPGYAADIVSLDAVGSSAWPVLLGLAIAAGAVWLVARGRRIPYPALPAGDLVVLLEHAYRTLRADAGVARAWLGAEMARVRRAGARVLGAALDVGRRVAGAERVLLGWTTGSVLFVLLAIGLYLLLGVA